MTTPYALDYRTIALSRGQIALVDEADYEWLIQWKWCARWDPKMNSYYATAYISGKMIPMHRLITGSTSPAVDHHNKNTLDNRRLNLRCCTFHQNQGNRKLNANNKSGFKGVSWDKENKKWKAQLDGKTLGRFSDPVDAAKVYDSRALAIFGKFASLNFPF